MADIGIRLVILGLAEFRRGVGSAQQDISSLEKTIRGVSGTAANMGTSLTNIGNSISGIGRSLTLSVTAPIIALTGALENAGIKFEDGFAGITKTVDGLAVGFDEIAAAAKTQFGITVTNMDEAREAAKKLGIEFGDLTDFGEGVKQQFRDLALEVPLPTNQLLHLGEVVGALGVNKDEIADVTRTIAQLGITTDISAEDAGVGIIKFGNILHGADLQVADFASHTGAALVNLGNNSVSTEGEILDMTLRLAAAGKQAGLSEAQILALGTTLADLGVPAELGGSAVSRVLNDMRLSVASGGQNLELFAKITGKTTEQFASDFRNNASAALIDFTEKFAIAVQKGEITQEMLTGTSLAGVRVADVFGRMAGSTDIFNRNLSVANEGWLENIALEEEAAKKTNTVAAQIQLLKNAFGDLGVTIFDLTKSHIIELIEFFRSLIKSFQELDPAAQKIILVIVGIAAAIGPVLVVVGTLIASLGAIISGFSVLISPIGIIIGLLLALAVAFAGVAVAFPTDILEGAQQVFDRIKGAIIELSDQIDDSITTKFSRAIELFRVFIVVVLGEFAKFLEINRHAITDFATKGVVLLADVFTSLGEFLVNVVLPVIVQLGRLFIPLKSIFETTALAVSNLADALAFDLGQGLAVVALRLISLVVDGLTIFAAWFAESRPTIEDFIAGVIIFFTNALLTLENIIERFVIPAFTILGNILNTFISIVMDVGEFIQSELNLNFADLADTIFQFVLTALNNFSAWFAANKDGIVATIETILKISQLTFGSIGKVINELVIPALNATGETLKESGVTWSDVAAVISAVVIGLGAIITGILLGIVELLNAFSEAWKFAVQGVKDQLEGLRIWLQGWGELFTGIFTLNFDLVLDGIADLMIGMFTIVKGGLENTAALLIAVFGGILSFIGGFITGVIEFFTNLSDELVGHSIIPDMVTAIFKEFERLGTSVNNVFAGIAKVIDKFTAKVQGMVSIVSSTVNHLIDWFDRLLNSITSSPTLTIQHPFERFEDFLKTTDFTFDLNMGSIDGLTSSLNSATSPSSTVSNSSVDRSINFGSITGVPMRDEVDLADLLTQRLEVVRT